MTITTAPLPVTATTLDRGCTALVVVTTAHVHVGRGKTFQYR